MVNKGYTPELAKGRDTLLPEGGRAGGEAVESVEYGPTS